MSVHAVGVVPNESSTAKKMQTTVVEQIKEFREKRKAIILAHVYQRDAVQALADFTGDSLALSRKAVETEAQVIVFCGVQFMAETAAILNPDKTVLLPVKEAGCELADMATGEEVRARKKQMPDATVVSYVNTTAEVKAESDICCTSSNAVDVVRSVGEGPVLFIPDRNLGAYAASVSGKDIHLWDGWCYVHENIRPERIQELRREHPEAKVMVHPECTPAVIDLADYVGSTAQMIAYASESQAESFIVGTEDGLLFPLKRDNPGKTFYPVGTICRGMKTITLERVKDALVQMQYPVSIPEAIRVRAKRALDRMLEL